MRIKSTKTKLENGKREGKNVFGKGNNVSVLACVYYNLCYYCYMLKHKHESSSKYILLFECKHTYIPLSCPEGHKIPLF